MHRKNIVFWLILVFITVFFVESISRLGLHVFHKKKYIVYDPAPVTVSAQERLEIQRIIEGSWDPRHDGVHDPFLGWVTKAGWETPDGMYRTNTDGIRSDREYQRDKLSWILRIASFGDSFTYGKEVANHETWQAKMEMLDPRSEVLNFGVPAYGLDQAYLRYLRDGKSFNPDIVLVGFLSENINRHVNVYRPFYSSRYGPLVKPRFILENGNLQLIPNPFQNKIDYQNLLKSPRKTIANLGEHDAYAQSIERSGVLDSFAFVRSVKLFASLFMHDWVPKKHQYYTGGIRGVYNPETEAYQVTEAIFDAFVDDIRSSGGDEIILLFPIKQDIDNFRSSGRKLYQPLITHFDERGYRYIDFLSVFSSLASDYAIGDLFAENRHYSSLGNAIVARAITAYIESNDFFFITNKARFGF